MKSPSAVCFARLPRRHAASVAVVCLPLAVAACSGSDRTNAGLGEGRYVLSTTQFQPDGETSLVGLVDDLGAGGVFDSARAVEVGGAAALFGADGRSVFALGSSDGGTLTRHELMADGQLVERGALSLQPYGISSAFKRPELVPFVSETKAYWIDDASLQVIIWNPTEMTVTGTFSLAPAARDGLLLELGEAVQRDGLLFVSASYRDDADGEAGEAVALVIDTASDSLMQVASDPRCGGTLDIAPGRGDELYFASNSFAASLYALGRPADYPAPCVLRIGAGAQAFDPDYYVSMLELTGGRPAGQLIRGVAGRYHSLALHDDLLDEPIGPQTELFAPYESAAWRWWSVDLDAPEEGAAAEGLPPRSAANRVLSAGGRQYIANADGDAGTTTLLAPDSDGRLGAGLQVTGYPYGLILLR